MPRSVEPGRRRVSVEIDEQVAGWAEEYARERGLGREYIYETALIQLRERVTRVG